MPKPLALIIDDNESVAELFSVALDMADFATEVAPDGPTALAQLEHITPVLIILDLHLPNMSGTMILEHIRANERLNETGVIMVTADVVAAEELNRKGILTLLKPVGIATLQENAKKFHPANRT